MAVFSYIGIDPSRKRVRGTINADTPRQARDSLRLRGIQVRKISPCAPATGGRRLTPNLRRLSLRRSSNHWATAVGELSMLLHAGIPLLDALDTIIEQSHGSFRAPLLAVRDRVAAGESFAQALAGQPEWFDAASVQMVQVGENAGNLEEVLSQLAEFKQRQSRLSDAVTTALVYPTFLVCFATAAGLFLMTSVLPPLLENLQETLPRLPWPTRVAKALSDGLIDYRWFWIAGAILVLVLTGLLRRSRRGRLWWDRFVLRMPLIGPMQIKQGVARIAMIIGTLSRSGVELTRAFQLAEASTGNSVFRDALQQCGERIAAGEDVADALAASGAFPPLAVRVFSVGQESGKLDDMLFRLAEDYDEQVKTQTARLTALIEPVLILVLAVMVGFLLLATILPILEAGNVL
ncbi:type II secretion system F family protein [Roseiconus nitratireducens]|uniref:Type II secretion system F family protein n=1 Tax=Roseiconus nitratireducens TaxID=2605748 RepID=A0A5M6D0R8_9BACT|nr:type II secretion system F family protein [Roseiconus nitratireducens]KAA5541077.1 type II secretion system F family protein [Roseiconus nitratireducens]